MPVWNKFKEWEEKELKVLFETTEMTYQEIADEMLRNIATIFKWVHNNYTKEEIKNRKSNCYRLSKLGEKNPMLGKYKEEHHNYKGECISGNGYVIILKPDWYSSRKKAKHVFKHHVVVCEHLGLTCIPKGWNVHHCDGNKLNNNFSNLVLLTLAAHTKLHWYLKRELKGATTISKESTLKWVEAHGFNASRCW